METLEAALDATAERTAFSGVVRVDRSGGVTELAKAYGLADRAHAIPNTLDTRFMLASITKGFTALAVMSLIDDGTLEFSTAARSVLGDDLPLIADDVTVEHLLAHRSGIGDYVDEDELDDINAYPLSVPVHRLDTTERFLEVLDGLPTVARAGERFSYNNGGYVVLALIAERASGVSYHELVRRRVTEPAGLADTGFWRTDELHGDHAIAYLHANGLRSNALHLPVLGNGDGGISSTAGDLAKLWSALFGGHIVPAGLVTEMTRPRSDWPEERRRYGMGFHLHPTGDALWLEGYDAGVSACTTHDPVSGITHSVIANWSDGAWPMLSVLDEHLGTA
jgi:CubicO group peptidase (beta-lactamase class C family)